MTNLVATTPITAKAMKSPYAKLNRQKDLKRIYRRRYKYLQAVVATTMDTLVTLPWSVVVTNSKANPNPQTSKAALEGQGKKTNDKGKAIKPFSKGKKNIAKSTANTFTTTSVV